MTGDYAVTAIRAHRGTGLRCRGWRQEALLRALENVLEIGERPQDLIVYASLGKAARDWPSYRAIERALLEMRSDETLVLQSGRPVATFRTSEDAPLVVSAYNNAVGEWQAATKFYELADAGLTAWGGLTAGAWQYIGAQGVLQGVYELLRAVATEHYAGDLAGRWLLTAGLGGMGSAQPLAARLAGASSLTVEVDPRKLQKVAERGWLDVVTDSLDDALLSLGAAGENHLVDELDRTEFSDFRNDSGVKFVDNAKRRPIAVGLCGNAALVYPELARRGVVPDIVTDMTAAHDARYGYVPPTLDLDGWLIRRESEPEAVAVAARDGMAAQVTAMLAMRDTGSVVFENGNNLRVQAAAAGAADAFEIRGFMERYLRPLFCRGIGPFRWIALSGDRADLDFIDDLVAPLVPERPEVGQWIELARHNVPVQGLPARSCWLGHGERSRVAVAVNDAVADGRLSAPVLFTRDHLDAAGMTHPRIGTEAMRDGSDGVSDWPILDALLLASTGADLVAVHAGGGGYSGWMQSAGVSIVADGATAAGERLRRGLDADTGLGVVRYAEAGYERAAAAASNINWIGAQI
jgi:urocanate hydratase